MVLEACFFDDFSLAASLRSFIELSGWLFYSTTLGDMLLERVEVFNIGRLIAAMSYLEVDGLK